ncbi:hypothetical protein [Sorangium sp. So ce124]|uniref:hypothetical protein n=1 Tax=Sorangium sp. So ce124 TaxID=3133280 RepID=UPI003F5D8CDB
MAKQLISALTIASNSPDANLNRWATHMLGRLRPFAGTDHYFWGAQQARTRADLERLQIELAQQEHDAHARLNAVSARLDRFKPDNRDTWDFNPVQYAAGLREADITDTPENRVILNNLRNGYLKDEHIKGTRTGMRYHSHINGGSGGILFEYRQQPDGTVTPYVIDVASKRIHGNDYVWKKGPKGPPY